MDYHKKPARLPEYSYNTPGYYYLTICTLDRENLLCTIETVPGSVEIQYHLTPTGEMVKTRLEEMSGFYNYAQIDKYIIMPNHVHFILQIKEAAGQTGKPNNNLVSAFTGTFKRLCTRDCGRNIWQARFYDHVIRDERDYLNIWNYIDGNPYKWADDDYYRR